jgi:hypothetical protein
MMRMTTMNEPDVQRLVAIEVLGRPGGRERGRMYRSLRLEREAIDDALASLETAGVLRMTATRVYATEALRRLESLALVGI